MPKLRHYDHLGTVRFITFSCFNRRQLLREPSIIRAFLQDLKQLRERNVRILGYVIMPEHVHLVLLPPDDMKLGREIGRLKAITAKKLLPLLDPLVKSGLLRQSFWYPRCYDHNCRNLDTVREKIEYCHRNPVIRDLAKAPGDWPWSSYRWYMGLKGIELEIDGLEL